MNFDLLPMTEADLPAFKSDIQEAFQKGFEDVYGQTDDIILPDKDITVHSMLKVQQHTRLLLTVTSEERLTFWRNNTYQLLSMRAVIFIPFKNLTQYSYTGI